MRFLIVALVLLLILSGVVAYFSFSNNGLDRVGAAPVAAAPTHDFTALCTLLEGDMSKIPKTINDPRQAPKNAFDIKAKLEGAVQTHEEYAVLNQVCDLIIYADQEHSVRQRQCSLEQQQAPSAGALDQISDSARNEVQATARQQIYQKHEALWENYRKQSDDEVKRLLATLHGKRL